MPSQHRSHNISTTTSPPSTSFSSPTSRAIVSTANPVCATAIERDVVGLDRSRHRLYGDGEELRVDVEDKGHPLPQVLAAAYAASMLTMRARPIVFRLLRRATLWAGAPGPALISFLTGDTAASAWTRVAVDARWARRALGFDEDDRPEKADVVRRYRDLVRIAHPDAGGLPDAAGERIARLSEARRILLAS